MLVEVAISLLQPWATLAALQYKRLETRSWSTSRRGPCAIHASKGKSKEVRRLCETDPYIRAALDAQGLTYDTLPFGAIIGVTSVAGVMQMQVSPTSCAGQVLDLNDPAQLSDQERAFGIYSHGRYAWVLNETRALSRPIPCAGSLQFWKLPPAIQQTLSNLLTNATDAQHSIP